MNALPASIGRYEVKAFIARGGMGTLYLASDPVLQRQVAIKVLREADNEELRARFTREARSAANLRHRNIVTIFDVGDHNGQPFMAMEYIHGQTLGVVIGSDPPPSTIRRLKWIEELCDGLSYAHKRGVVHRDIKPANLMVDADGTLKILDFGIARAAAELGMTQVGLLVGTLNYMSPEQVAGAALDGRSDMFAVGAVLYELLSRRQAFPGSMDGGVLNKILNSEPEPIETLCPHLDPTITEIVRRALQKDPHLRFPDLQKMGTEIAQTRKTLESSTFAEGGATITPAPQPNDAARATPAPSSRRGTDREDIARRRAQQIEAHLTAARQALAGAEYDDAIALCEQALLVDPNESRALDLAERARVQRDEANVRELLAQAKDSLKKGELTTASSCVREALSLTPDSSEAIELGRVISETRLARERERQRAAAVTALIERARRALDDGDPEAAMAACDEAVALAPAHDDARQIKERAQQAIASRQREAHDREARQTADEARQLFAAGEHAEALALLEEFLPAHPIVSQLWSQLSAEAARLAREQQGASPYTERIAADPEYDPTVFAPRSQPTLTSRAPTATDAWISPPASEKTISSPSPPTGALPTLDTDREVPWRFRPAPPSSKPARSVSRARPRVALYAAAVALLVSIGAGIFFAMRGDDSTNAPSANSDGRGVTTEARTETPPGTAAPPPSTPAPVPETPTAAATPPVVVDTPTAVPPSARERALDGFRQAVRRYLRSEDYSSALSSAVSGLRVDPNDSELRAALLQIEKQARSDASTARGTAPAGRPPSARYAEASSLMQNALRMAETDRHEAAIRAYWRAEELFIIARNEPPPPSPKPATVPPPAEVVEAKPPLPTPQTGARPPGPESAVIPSPPPPVREAPRETPTVPERGEPSPPARVEISDDQLIRAALNEYAQAYRSLNSAEVMRIYPSVNGAQLKTAFEEARSQEMRIENVQISVTGNRAIVRCRVFQRVEVKAGPQPDPVNRNTEFEMEKKGGLWFILRRR